MHNSTWSPPTNRPLPVILIRGFGGLGVEDEKKVAYQGFNDGTVYPDKRGENYIYEGLVLRFLKSDWEYRDATNIVGYYSDAIADSPTLPEGPPEIKNRFEALRDLGFFSGERVVVDPAMALALLRSPKDPRRTLWIFRYYDLDERKFEVYGKALVRLIDFVQALAFVEGAKPPKVNIIAHSMGGLLVREAIQRVYPAAGRKADEYINKVVTLGTPHKGISFQIFKQWGLLDAGEEIERFNPENQADPANPVGWHNFARHFPPERLLAVVGTNYRTYGVGSAVTLNRIFSNEGEFGPNYNRSDGLVKQSSAQLPGAPRTFAHKCHGGFDSLVTSREAFEVATRFFYGNLRAKLRLISAKVKRGQDLFGKSEFFFGVSIKPRRVDFDLFHQSVEAENCYGPFRQDDLADPNPAFGWADENRLIWEGYLDVRRILEDPSATTKDLVLRLDFYVGERDLFGIGFSDNIVFRKQYYLRALLTPPVQLQLHTGEAFAAPSFDSAAYPVLLRDRAGWLIYVEGTGFEATLRAEVDSVPEEGHPLPLIP